MTYLLIAALACERLATVAVPHAVVTSAQSVAAGALAEFNTLPALCRVAATLTPSPDSDIKMELWLPAANWNGKFQEVGNGAFSGSIALPAMAAAGRRGYAAAPADTRPTRQTPRVALGPCDAQDGVKDGVVDDPARCTFDPATLQCASEKTASCLTAAQVRTAKMLYEGRSNPKTTREITGLARGSELGWTESGWSASARATGLDQFRYLVFKDPHWDVRAFDFDVDIARAEAADNDTINAVDLGLKAFVDRGGKLIQYHGWSFFFKQKTAYEITR